jgi:Ferric reductase like transmembrane component
MSSSALWYLTRGTGAVSLILLTLTVALGVANVRRARTATVPRFVFEAVHRNAALLSVAFLLVHVVSAVLDRYAPIRVIDAIIPFGSAYRPVWLGFGAVAFDLMIAVAVTSMIRRRLGYRAWRATHWAAYASWPVALIHGLGTGSDTKTTWMLGLTAICVIVVFVAAVARATAGWPERSGIRISALGAAAVVPLSLLVWLPEGPLAAGWAQRAGTPSSLLGAAGAGTGSQPTVVVPLSGSISQMRLNSGLERVDIRLHTARGSLSSLHIVMDGQPLDGGGVQMSSSSVSLGSASNPTRYRGSVVSLAGTHVHARVKDSSGARLGLIAELRIAPGSSSVTGTLIQRTINR